ncbi:MAG: type II toxin-antitoxin system VapC family toxin [Bradyrhizobiaceae bacterium]|nr:type II toxin-antitoxin system VapC family toxin [Bradyrhizobiaceae bacterium]
MRILLDTHVALWAVVDDPRLSARARSLIEDEDNVILASAASVWEIAIKRALARGGPNDMPISGAQALEFFQAAGYEMLAITGMHASAVDHLPAHHSDPFDRLLVAQATTEPARLLTHDTQVAKYGDGVILV